MGDSAWIGGGPAMAIESMSRILSIAHGAEAEARANIGDGDSRVPLGRHTDGACGHRDHDPESESEKECKIEDACMASEIAWKVRICRPCAAEPDNRLDCAIGSEIVF